MLIPAPESDTPDTNRLLPSAHRLRRRPAPKVPVRAGQKCERGGSEHTQEQWRRAMLETVKTHSNPLELDKALQYAVTLAWEDLMKPAEPRLVRVEYLCEPGTALDHLSVWSVRAGGYQDLVCDCWTWASVAHPRGAAFGNRHYSDKLAQTLDFVMKN